MKLKTKTNNNKGFTLIEMIGVLAVIAILAALLIPKVFQAITEARINTVPVGQRRVRLRLSTIMLSTEP
jgi:prepilin-type N-terminal cleavage/methylation domain-containing protein